MRNREKDIVLRIYAALTVSLFLSAVPTVSAAVFASVLFIGAWSAAGLLRRRAEEGSLLQNHTIFIIRTLWIAALFGLATTTLASAYVLSVYNPAILADCAGAIGVTDIEALKIAVMPCLDDFIAANRLYFINGTVIAAAPLLAYMALRLGRGLPRAVKGHRIGNVKSWF